MTGPTSRGAGEGWAVWMNRRSAPLRLRVMDTENTSVTVICYQHPEKTRPLRPEHDRPAQTGEDQARLAWRGRKSRCGRTPLN